MSSREVLLDGNRFRCSNFYVALPLNHNMDVVWAGCHDFQTAIREFVLVGTLNLLPNGHLPDVDHEAEAHPMPCFFFLKSRRAGGRLQFAAHEIDFLRIRNQPNFPLMTSPLRGRRDYLTDLFRKFVSEPYRAIDRHGNNYNLDSFIGVCGDARQQEMMVKIRLGQITTYDEVWTLYPRNVKKYYRSILYHLEIADEERLRRAAVQRVIGFRELNYQWRGEEGIRLAVLQRLTQFWNVKLFGLSQQKDFTGLYLWSRSSNLGKSALVNTIAEIAYTYKHCTTDNGWQDNFGYTKDHHMMYQVYFVDGIQSGKDFDYNIMELISTQNVKIKRRYKNAGILRQYTPIILTSNIAPGILYPNTLVSLSERMMFINCEGCELFRFINRVRDVHGLPMFNEHVVQRMDQML